ncbi:uncharacterized protein [Panulirus ornatus]|uniref:uncharacterized protein n=1 Tax=Panulirus ornatus TaxID=150431 RepID=UPI003A8C4FA7
MRTSLQALKRSLPTAITALMTLLFYIIFVEQPNVLRKTSSEMNDALSVAKKGDAVADVVCYPRCFIQPVFSAKEYHDYFTKMEGTCSRWEKFGVKGAPWGGLKYVCLDPKFNIRPGNCTVLSFGIDNEWSFDDDFDAFGCKVYSFDPTMGKEDHDRSRNIKFLSLGISNADSIRTVGMDANFKPHKVSRFVTILERLNLTHTPIDYVKMDVEWSELDFFQDMFFNTPHLLKNIKQIGMEIHDGDSAGDLGPKTLYQHFWFYYQLLRCHGFKLIHARQASIWHEVVWAREDNW